MHRSLSITTTQGNTTKLHDERSNILYAPVLLDDIIRLNANRIFHQRSVSNDVTRFTIQKCSLDNTQNIQDYICPRKSKLPPERYKKHSYIHVLKNLIRGKSGQRLMCLNSSGLRSTDNIKFDSDSVDIFPRRMCDSRGNPFQT